VTELSTAATTPTFTSAHGHPAGGGHLRVLVLFGGRSAEHGVSCLSAANVVSALRSGGHDVVLVGITRDGRWSWVEEVPSAPPGEVPAVSDEGATLALVPTRKGPRLVRFGDDFVGEDLGSVDVCFPVLHGPYGEDGTVQGMLASMGVPYVGSGVAASAVGIDKRQMKNVFTARGLPQVAYLTVRLDQWQGEERAWLDRIESSLGYPVFAKPNCQGSSFGISKCRNRAELMAGMAEAYSYDRVAVVEQGLEGLRELECGVIGNADVRVAGPGEVITDHDFYDFSGKYLDDEHLRLACPADVPPEVIEQCRSAAVRAYRAIGARGMARVDFFYLESSGTVLVNEINTIPGFTSASMFPYVWAAEGLDNAGLVDELLALALAAGRSDLHFSP
jgi:D-alanine-D-alanine ligase